MRAGRGHRQDRQKCPAGPGRGLYLRLHLRQRRHRPRPADPHQPVDQRQGPSTRRCPLGPCIVTDIGRRQSGNFHHRQWANETALHTRNLIFKPLQLVSYNFLHHDPAARGCDYDGHPLRHQRLDSGDTSPFPSRASASSPTHALSQSKTVPSGPRKGPFHFRRRNIHEL